MEYQVTAGYVTVPTAVDGGVAHVDIPRGEQLPADVPADHVQVLLDRGHIAPVDEAGEEPVEVEEPPPGGDQEPVPDGTAAQVLEWVAGDTGRAARAMKAEAGRDKPRSGLIADLGKLVDPQ